MGSDKLIKDIQCKQAKPKDKDYFLNDGLGLRLQIKSDGSKKWQFRYTYNGKRRTTTFKSYPKVSLENARNKKYEFLDLLAKGIDPINKTNEDKEKTELEQKSIFPNVMYEWLDNEKPNASISQYEWKKNRFEKDILPFLKDKTINQITTQNIVEVIKSKNNKAPETASKLFGYLKNFFSYSVIHGYCERNIMLDMNKSHLITKTVVKNMPKITDKEIFKELVNSIYNYHGGFSIRNALKVVLHIPLRAENLCTMKWEHIDFDKKLLIIPRENMKLKNPNLEDFKMPLTDEVISILKEQQEELKNYGNPLDYVFIGSKNFKDHINKESPNKALQLMSFNDEKKGRKIRLHGFRSTFRSLIDTLDVNNQFSFDVKERALDHQEKSKVVRAYSHKADFEVQLRDMMNFWSKHIVSLLDEVKGA